MTFKSFRNSFLGVSLGGEVVDLRSGEPVEKLGAPRSKFVMAPRGHTRLYVDQLVHELYFWQRPPDYVTGRGEELWAALPLPNSEARNLFWVSTLGRLVTSSGKPVEVKVHWSGNKTIANVKGEGPYDLRYLVAETFLPNPSYYPFAVYQDGNIQNNRVENLEWKTHDAPRWLPQELK